MGVDRFELFAGTCFVLPPGCQPDASHRPERPLSVFAVHFNLVGPGEQPTEPMSARVKDVAYLTALAERCEIACAAGGELNESEAHVLVQALVLMIANEANAPPDKRDEAIMPLVEAIRSDPARRWTVDELADQACLSRSQLTRRFESAMGTPAIEYVIGVRLDRAARQLVETGQPVSAIAAALGYDDPHYFSRQFRARHGVSPTEYRKRGM